MSRPRAKSDWWETFLWFGLFILIAMFIYQMLKLWNQGVATVDNAASTVSTALGNTATELENFLTGLVTSPIAAIESVFSSAPDFLNLFFNFASSLFLGGALSSILSWGYSLFAGLLSPFFTAPIVTTGLGSSYSGVVPTSPIPAPVPIAPPVATFSSQVQ